MRCIIWTNIQNLNYFHVLCLSVYSMYCHNFLFYTSFIFHSLHIIRMRGMHILTFMNIFILVFTTRLLLNTKGHLPPVRRSAGQ